VPVVPAALVLSLYWFAMLAALGTFFPLYSLYLTENLGLSGLQTGLVTAALPLSGMLAQPAWGSLADRSGRRVWILTVVTAATAAGYFHLSTQRSFSAVLAATLLLAVFSTSVMPMSVSVSMALLREKGRYAFGMVRSVGTLATSSRWRAFRCCCTPSPMRRLPSTCARALRPSRVWA